MRRKANKNDSSPYTMRRRDDVERAFWLADLTCFYLLCVYLCILSAPAFLFSTEPKSLHLSFIPFLLTLPSSLTRPYPAFLFQLTSIQVADLSNYSTSIHFPRPSILYINCINEFAASKWMNTRNGRTKFSRPLAFFCISFSSIWPEISSDGSI